LDPKLGKRSFDRLVSIAYQQDGITPPSLAMDVN